jgi:hypothetical protein
VKQLQYAAIAIHENGVTAYGAYQTKKAADQAAALLGVTTTGVIAIRTLALTRPRLTVSATLRVVTPARIAVVPRGCAGVTEPETSSFSSVAETMPVAVWILGSTPSMIGRGESLIGALIGPFESISAARLWVRTDPQLPGQSLLAHLVVLQNATALMADPVSSGAQSSDAEATPSPHEVILPGVVITRSSYGTWHACGPFADQPTAATYLEDINSALNLINRTHHGALAVRPPTDAAKRDFGDAGASLACAATRPHIVLLIHDGAAFDDNPRTEYELSAFGWFTHPDDARAWVSTHSFDDGTGPITVRVDDP